MLAKRHALYQQARNLHALAGQALLEVGSAIGAAILNPEREETTLKITA